jgi:hypothetical protein
MGRVDLEPPWCGPSDAAECALFVLPDKRNRTHNAPNVREPTLIALLVACRDRKLNRPRSNTAPSLKNWRWIRSPSARPIPRTPRRRGIRQTSFLHVADQVCAILNRRPTPDAAQSAECRGPCISWVQPVEESPEDRWQPEPKSTFSSALHHPAPRLKMRGFFRVL